MNKEDTINIDQLISKLKQMFDADDAACRAYEAFNRGEVPYDEFEINNEVRDILWRELKENIDTFSKLSCSECKMYDVCDKSQRELNQFCSSFTASFKKIPKSTMNGNANTCRITKLTAPEIRLAYNNIKVSTGIFSDECVDVLLKAGFNTDNYTSPWADVPFLYVIDNNIIPCYSPRSFFNSQLKEVDILELLCLEIIEEESKYCDEHNNCIFDIDDVEYIKNQLYDIVEFMKSKHPGKSIVINDKGVSVIPFVIPIYSPTEKGECCNSIVDNTDYSNTEIRG